MAFQHGKNARLWVDQYELTSYFNDFTMAAKAGIAETTVYGKGAKTFIGGLKEGQISGKGFFDATSTGNDQEMTAALGRAVNMNVTMIPSGKTVAMTRAVVAFAAETDYQIMTPVNNVVAVSFAAQADSGLSTGVLLYDPTAAAVTTAATFGNPAGVTVAAGSNAVNTNTFTGSGTLNVSATTGFASAGIIVVATGGTTATISYTGTTGTTFTGCTTLSGGGALATGGAVNQGMQDNLAQSSSTGLVCNFHCLTITGTGANGTLTPKLQHSADGATWADLIGGGGTYAFAQTAFNTTTAPSGPSATVGLVPANVTINQYLRLVYTTTVGTTLSTTFFASVARQ